MNEIMYAKKKIMHFYKLMYEKLKILDIFKSKYYITNYLKDNVEEVT
jgi:hypothetical protein